jgi:asparagine synthase (glutamine-hydrolysing)
MKVVQVGEGADELFFGYKTYADYATLHRRIWQPSQRFIPALVRKSMYHAARPLFEDQPLKADIMHNWAQNRALFWGGAIAFSEMQKQTYLQDIRRHVLDKDDVIDQIYPGFSQAFDSHSIVDYHLKKLRSIDPQADIVKQMMYLELKQRLPELLLMRADKMSMAASIEAREPFLDHHLVEFMMHVPGALKFKNQTTKYLLKKVAEQFLPKEIIYRQKVGFGAPLAEWFSKGQYFPRYFEQLSYDAHYNQRAELATPLWQVSDGMNKNHAHRAVQNWVLQQLWAFTGQG